MRRSKTRFQRRIPASEFTIVDSDKRASGRPPGPVERNKVFVYIMSSSVTTLEVEKEGQKARLLRLDKPEVTIGFAPRCHLALEPYGPSGPELMLVIHPPAPCLLRATRSPESFQLNGAPCGADDMPITRGAVISSGVYRITIRELPGEGEHAEVSQPALRGSEPAPVLNPASGAKPPESAAARSRHPDEGLAYLYLFFAPVEEFLRDDEVAEIMINGPRQIYIERKGALLPVASQFSSEQALQAAVMNVARSVGRFFDKDNPRLDARMPDGSRVHAVMPPLSRSGTTVAIRKFRRERLTLQQLIEFSSISPEGATLLEVVVKLGKNLIVSGATSSGKTSVLNVLSGLIPENERILVLEDASELQLQQIHKVCFETRKPDEHGKGEVTIRDLLHSALRLRPDRLVVGEIRGGEALDLLQAMNTGHEGSMSTIHANSARDSLFRLETCALLSGIDIPLSALREQVASAIHIVIQTARMFDGSRKITGITEVLGLKEGQYQMRDVLLFQQESVSPDGKIKGRHVITREQPTFLAAAQQRGLAVSFF